MPLLSGMPRYRGNTVASINMATGKNDDWEKCFWQPCRTSDTGKSEPIRLGFGEIFLIHGLLAFTQLLVSFTYS